MSFIRDISERMPDGWTGLDVLDSWEFPISKRPPIAGWMGDKPQRGLHGSIGSIECYRQIYLKSWGRRVLFKRSLDHLSHKKQRSLTFFDGGCCQLESRVHSRLLPSDPIKWKRVLSWDCQVQVLPLLKMVNSYIDLSEFSAGRPWTQPLMCDQWINCAYIFGWKPSLPRQFRLSTTNIPFNLRLGDAIVNIIHALLKKPQSQPA